jgi:hypothetical protein
MRGLRSRQPRRRLVPGLILALLAMLLWLSGSRCLVICQAGDQHRGIELSHAAEGCPDTLQECGCEGDDTGGDQIHGAHHGVCEDVPALGPLAAPRRAAPVPAPAKLAVAALPTGNAFAVVPPVPLRRREDELPRAAPPPGNGHAPLVLRI